MATGSIYLQKPALRKLEGVEVYVVPGQLYADMVPGQLYADVGDIERSIIEEASRAASAEKVVH